MSDEFVIKSDPPPVHKARKQSGRPRKYPFESMWKGSAIGIDRDRSMTAYNSYLRFQKRNPDFKFKIGDDPEDENKSYIHCIESPVIKPIEDEVK